MTNIITAVVTAYCACTTCCGPNATGTNAAGLKAVEGTIAASRTIPFGSTVIINKRRYVVRDRLAKRYDKRFDIFMSSHAKAKEFGICTNVVTIIVK